MILTIVAVSSIAPRGVGLDPARVASVAELMCQTGVDARQWKIV